MHEHKWAKAGLYTTSGLVAVPCIDCFDELLLEGDVPAAIIEDGFKPKFDLKFAPDNDGVNKIICREIDRSYRLDGLNINAGDFIIDIGAHKGIVSCYLAKTYPQARVLAFEPLHDNYFAMLENIRLNGLTNVSAWIYAVTKDGRDVTIEPNPDNSGGQSIYDNKGQAHGSMTLNDIFAHHKINRLALLKIDCEGAEYEILDTDLLSHIDHLRGEFHRGRGDAFALYKKVKTAIPDTIVTIQGSGA